MKNKSSLQNLVINKQQIIPTYANDFWLLGTPTSNDKFLRRRFASNTERIFQRIHFVLELIFMEAFLQLAILNFIKSVFIAHCSAGFHNAFWSPSKELMKQVVSKFNISQIIKSSNDMEKQSKLANLPSTKFT